MLSIRAVMPTRTKWTLLDAAIMALAGILIGWSIQGWGKAQPIFQLRSGLDPQASIPTSGTSGTSHSPMGAAETSASPRRIRRSASPPSPALTQEMDQLIHAWREAAPSAPPLTPWQEQTTRTWVLNLLLDSVYQDALARNEEIDAEVAMNRVRDHLEGHR